MNLLADLRLAWRRLASAPGYTALVVLTLGLGLAATTTLAAVVETVLLRPLPYRGAESLVRLYETFAFKGATPDGGPPTGSVSWPNLLDWRRETRSFAAMAAYAGGALSLEEGGRPERLVATWASADLFEVLGVAPQLGRGFVAGEDRPGADAVAVVSHELWQRRFGADRGLVGRTLRLDGRARTVVGVMPEGFRFPAGGRGADVWVPLVPTPQQAEARGWHWASVVARLAPGVAPAAAEADLVRVAASLETRYPQEQEGRRAVVRPLRQVVTGGVRPMLLVLLGAAALVLCIAWANTANLQLVRAVGRRRELATRAALGAGRGRIAATFLGEAVLLSLGGAAVGLGLAVAALRAIRLGASDFLPRATELSLRADVFAVLVLLTLASAVACGLVPALQATRADLHDELKDGARGGSTRSGQRFRRALVVAQVALSVVLLVGAGLLVRTLATLLAVDSGIRAEHVVTAHLSAADESEGYDPATRLFRPVLERVRALPGVEAAGWISLLPIESYGSNGNFAIAGRPPVSIVDAPFAEWREISSGYFAALGIPVLRGRDFSDDEPAGAKVVIVNQALVDTYFPDGRALGAELRLGGGPDGERFSVVGVVGNVRGAGLDREALPELYLPYTTHAAGSMVLAVRTKQDPATLAPALHATLREVDPGVPFYDVAPMREVIAASLAGRRLFLVVLAAFAAVALLLAMAGIYGVVAFAVSSRTREIGIRMALGASAPSVRAMVLRQAAGLALAGIALGLPASLLLSRVLASVLYGVAPTDTSTLAAVAFLLALVALLASWVPAGRATRVPPVVALRAE